MPRRRQDEAGGSDDDNDDDDEMEVEEVEEGGVVGVVGGDDDVVGGDDDDDDEGGAVSPLSSSPLVFAAPPFLPHSVPTLVGGGRRRRPWQWDWKRPAWHGPVKPVASPRRGAGAVGGAVDVDVHGEDRDEDEDEDGDASGYDSFHLLPTGGASPGVGVVGRPVDHAAAHVSFDEVRSMATTRTTTMARSVRPPPPPRASAMGRGASPPTEPPRPGRHYVLAVTLLASASASASPPGRSGSGPPRRTAGPVGRVGSGLPPRPPPPPHPPPRPALGEVCADSVLLELVRTDEDSGRGRGGGGSGHGESSSPGEASTPASAAVDAPTRPDDAGRVGVGAAAPRDATVSENLKPRIVRSRLLRWPASVVGEPSRMGAEALTERDRLLEGTEEDEDDEDEASSPSPSPSSSSSSSSNDGKSGGEKAEGAPVAEVSSASKPSSLLGLWPWGKDRNPSKANPPRPHREPGPTRPSLLNREGLVSACWCRLPGPSEAAVPPSAAADAPEAGDAAAAEDAMDVVRFLALGLPAQPPPPSHRQSTPVTPNPVNGEWVGGQLDDDDGGDDDDGERVTAPVKNERPSPPRELYLALLSSTGTVYLYSPWVLLAATPERWEESYDATASDTGAPPSDMDLDRGMAELWFGPSLFTKVHELYEPLSLPLHRLFLSVPILSAKSKRVWEQRALALDGTEADPINVESSFQSDISECNEDETDEGGSTTREALLDEVEPDALAGPVDTQVSLWDPAVWDSWVDQETLPFQTRDNRPLRCVVAWEQLCVMGKGRRKSSRRDQRRFGIRRGWSDAGSLSTFGRSTSSWGGRSKNRSASSTRATEISADVLERHYDGGFVTFFSMRTFSQVRTVFIPFVPRDISPIAWGGMSFVLVLGRRAHEAVAIRVDARGIVTFASSDSPASNRWSESTLSAQSRDSLMSGSALLQSAAVSDRNQAEQGPEVALRRFEMLAVEIPDTEDLTPLVGGCEMRTSPPCVVLVFVDEHEGQITVMRRFFKGVFLRGGPGGVQASQPFSSSSPSLQTTRTIATELKIENLARFTLPSSVLVDDHAAHEFIWCKSGQGWSVLGVSNRRYVICWDGSTIGHGAFVAEIGSDEQDRESHHTLVDHVLPLDPFSAKLESDTVPLTLPFTGSSGSIFIRGIQEHQSPLVRFNSSRNVGVLDDIVVEALRSLSSEAYRTSANLPSSAKASPRRASAFSHVEKSQMLLRQCSSWTQLEASNLQTARFASQMPVLTAKVFGLHSWQCELSLLSLRKAFVANGRTSPFQQVLSWLLTEREDFFAAASIALDLLRDGASLRLLWKAFDKVEDDAECDNLEGLLDGVEAPASSGEGDERQLAMTLTQLADMTVGCLTKGGYRMAPTLEHFLEFDQHYDANRASLMLVATAVNSVSQDEDVLSQSRDRNAKRSMDSVLWPVRCLLKLASTRGTLETALLLLNAAIPDELRRRNRRGMAASSLPSRDLCRSLITLIVKTSPDATELLLHLVDDASGRPYWESINNETKQDLALIETSGGYVLIRQPEVKGWLVQQLQKQLLSEVTAADVLPTLWLQGIVLACLSNAGCGPLSFLDAGVHLDTSTTSAQKLVQQYGEEVTWLREAVSQGRGLGQLDFDVIVPVLLILQIRSAGWRAVDTEINFPPTQYLLNAICYVAGRRTNEVEKDDRPFAPDMSTLMRQCALANNVQAGANLVGGSNGLVLECCDILMSQLGISMDLAEGFLLAESILDVTPATTVDLPFTLSRGHIHLMWLLECHVLDIRTYGDFESTVRGRVDPVLASRLLFRSWYLLTREAKRESNEFLTEWLREKLQMTDDRLSPRRLVCAALSRALLWPTGVQHKRDLLGGARSGTNSLLAAKLELSSSFLVSLTRSCLGLVEAVPPQLEGDKLMLSSAVNLSNTSQASRKDVSFLSARNNSFLNESADDSFASAASSLRELDA